MVESNVARKVDRHESQQFTADILYGFINALMVFPVSISFCSIIFRNEFFRGHIPLLVKLVLFSSAIHQFTFSTFSSLPFAVGQVQDAGLIFLSAIASSIVESHKDQSIEKDVTLSTTLVILALSTFFLGICLILLGKLRLASYLQYLPMPVVGGYLAFIGFFCGSAGIGMMAGIEITSIADWYYIANEKSILHVVPGVAAGCLYYMLLYSIKSPWTLPCLMLGTLVIFYAVLFFRGLTFEQARDNDWMMPQSPHGTL